MTSDTSPRPVSPLRARMIEDMTVRGFKEDTRRDYVRHVRAFAAFIGRSPDTATAEDLRLFQLHQTQSGLQPPSINSAVSALRFFFTVTLDRPDLARRLTVVPYPRRIPTAPVLHCIGCSPFPTCRLNNTSHLEALLVPMGFFCAGTGEIELGGTSATMGSAIPRILGRMSDSRRIFCA